MPPASQTIEFEGYFAEGVLGIFKIIRGFADLRDLAAISVPYELSDGAETRQVPFDLTTFKYVPISQAAEIPNKVKPEIVAILRDTDANLIERIET